MEKGEKYQRFYDKLRSKVVDFANKKGEKWGKLAELLLVAPDIFVLLVRLSLDKEVPYRTRAIIGGAIAYFMIPFDIFPEGIVGGMGYLDDLLLAVTVLAHVFDDDLLPFVEKYWSGDKKIKEVIRDVVQATEKLFGIDFSLRIKELISSWEGKEKNSSQSNVN